MEKYVSVSEIAEQMELTIMYAVWFSDDGRYVNSFLGEDEIGKTVQFDLETDTYEIKDAILFSCVEKSEEFIYYIDIHTLYQYNMEEQKHTELLEHVSRFQLSGDGDRILYVTPMEAFGQDDYAQELYCYQISSDTIMELEKINSDQFKFRDWIWLDENYAYVKSCYGLEGEAFIAVYT